MKSCISIANYFKCHPFIIHSSFIQATDNLCSKISRGSHHGCSTTSYETQIICLFIWHPPEQWFFHVQRLCIATSLFQQDVSLLFSKDPHCSSSGRNVCKDIYAVSSQHPGLSNIVGDYCLFIFIAFSCYGIFRGLVRDWFLSLYIASSYSSSHKLTTKIFHTSSFFFWWNIFPPHCAGNVYFGLSTCSELLPSLHTVQLSFTSCFMLCNNPKSWKSHQTSLKNCFLPCEKLINARYATIYNVICTSPSSLHFLNNPPTSGTGEDA